METMPTAKTVAAADGKTLYAKLLEAGVPWEKLDNHYSDLYVLATPKSREIIQAHFSELGEPMPKTFKNCDEIPPRLWYDIPFQYIPFWEAVTEESRLTSKNRKGDKKYEHEELSTDGHHLFYPIRQTETP